MTDTRAPRRPLRRTSAVAAGALALAVAASTLLPGDGADRASADPTAPGEPAADAPAYPAAATPTAVTWTGELHGQAPCPEGMTRSGLLHRQTFGGGIPESRFNNGWFTFTGLDGTASARGEVHADDGADHFFLPYVEGAPGARTMLALATKSTQSDPAYTRAQVNSVDVRVASGSSWAGRVYDVTAATDDEGGWLGTWFQHRSKSGAQSHWDLDNVQLYTCRAAPVSRIAGEDRYATAAEVSAGYPSGVEVAYLATGLDFPDAVGASALAADQDAPILLTRPGALPAPTREALDRLRPERLVVLGGTRAVSTEVEQEAGAYAGSTERFTGEDRYEVSAAIASGYEPGVPVLYVASGADFPDALTVGALAGRTGTPVLLTPQDKLSSSVEEQIARLDPGRIVVVGGPAAVSDEVVELLRPHTAGGVTRIEGTDRYAVAAAVAGEFPDGPAPAYLASGQAFPDALVGAALAGSQGVPVLLSRTTALPGVTADALGALEAARAVLLGGPAALTSVVMDQTGAHVG